jgi:hypothetical protein
MDKTDLPGLHFTVREGQETNVKFSGTPDSNPDLSHNVNGEDQVILRDELGFLWRTESKNFALARSTRVIGLNLPAKLQNLGEMKSHWAKKLSADTKQIFLVKTKNGLLNEKGEEINLEFAQNALWLRADGLAPLSRAYLALKAAFQIKPSHWDGHVNTQDGLELIEVPLTEDLVIQKG